jgi:phospholipid/cholesterol/gamma-HCH transport system substrate-binding protein
LSTLARNLIRGVIALVCVSLTVMGTVAMTDAGSGPVSVTATMKDATPLRNGNIVRASGVNVGTIQSVTLNGHGEALVNMSVSRDVLPLHQDATLQLIPQDLLGERFVALNPGTPSAPVMSEPYSIPVTQTSNAVDLQSVVDMVDDPTGTSLAMMLTTLGEGIGKNPTETAQAIKALQPALQNTQQLAQVLNDQNLLLNRLVDTAAPVAKAVATQRGATFDRLIGSVTRTLQVTARDRQQLNDTAARLPGTLQSVNNTLGHIAGVAPPTTQSLRDLRPITDDLVDVSHELRDFSDSADPALDSLVPVLKKGRHLLDELRPAVRDLRHGTRGLVGVSRSYRHLADGALSTRLVDLLEFMKGWSLSTSDYDAQGHYFRDILPYDPKTGGETAAGPIPGAPQNPAPAVPLPRGGRTPLPFGGTPNTPNEGGPYLPQLPHGTPNPNQESNGVTGLSGNQENSMMDQLLGGK